MNVKFEHRAQDLAAPSVYTWANSKDDKSAAAGVGATAPATRDSWTTTTPAGLRSVRLRRRPAIRSQLCLSAPFGRGKKFASGVNRATDLLIGGWETTGIATFQAGFPYSVGASDIRSAPQPVPAGESGSGLQLHANLTKYPTDQPGLLHPTGAGHLWQHSRNFLRQPGINNWDMGVGKNFRSPSASTSSSPEISSTPGTIISTPVPALWSAVDRAADPHR